MSRRRRARVWHHQLVNSISPLHPRLADFAIAIAEIECLRIRLNPQLASFFSSHLIYFTTRERAGNFYEST